MTEGTRFHLSEGFRTGLQERRQPQTSNKTKKKKFLILSHVFFERRYMLVFLKFLLGRTVSVVSCTEEAAVDLQLLTFISVGHQS